MTEWWPGENVRWLLVPDRQYVVMSVEPATNRSREMARIRERGTAGERYQMANPDELRHVVPNKEAE